MAHPARIPSHGTITILLVAGGLAYGTHELNKRGYISIGDPKKLDAVLGGCFIAFVVVASIISRVRVMRALRALMDDTPLKSYRELSVMVDEKAEAETRQLKSLPTITLSDGLDDANHRILNAPSVTTKEGLPKALAVMVATKFLHNLSHRHPGWGLARQHRLFGFNPKKFTLLLIRERADNEREFAGIAIQFNQHREEITVTVESHAIRPSPWKVFLLEWVYGAVTAMAKSGSPRGYRFAAERTCAMMVPSVYAALEEVVTVRRPR